MPVQAAAQPFALNRAWSRTFPATAQQVREARRYLARVMGDLPAASNAALCLSELATNAVVHSRSGRPGGQFSVSIARAAGLWRIGVGDEGGAWREHSNDDGLHNRGLAIVGALSRRWQVEGDCRTGRVVWFEIPA